MIIFFYEFLHFLSSSLAVLVCISSAVLFVITYRYERKLQTGWRAAGFMLLALAYLLFILERKEPYIEILALVVEAVAIFCIFKGVLAEPNLLQLKKVDKTAQVIKTKTKKKEKEEKLSKTGRLLLFILVLVIIVSIFLLPGYLFFVSFLPSIIETITVCLIIATLVMQYRRYKNEKNEKTKVKEWQNLYPLIGYLFLLIRGLVLIFYRLPELDFVILRLATLEYSVVWLISVAATFVAFIYLGIWAWNFVKIRVFLRTYVVFISIVLVVATIGSLLFTFLLFQVLEDNNLDLMLKGAETESIIMRDRSNTSMFISRLISEDTRFLQEVRSNNYKGMHQIMENYLDSSEADILRVYNIFGEVIVSPSDQRDEGKLFAEDNMVAFALMERKQVRSFDTYPGVLADFIVTRAVHPLIVNNTVIGAVEVGYKFDNAFVDFSKEKANLDVTMYTGNKISATTIKTLDEVSRFVGTEELRTDINVYVLDQGQTFTTILERFGELYYSAFSPIRNVNGVIIGMVSVGTPTFYLTEATRQRLLTTFIIVAALSVFVSLIGYYAMPNLRQAVAPEEKKKPVKKTIKK